MGFEAALPASSYLEWAFLRWILSPALHQNASTRVVPQQPVAVDGRNYRIDYELVGEQLRVAVELDGFEFHGSRHAFTYDRLRQNDLTATGRQVIRFTYDSIRSDTARCVEQLQAVLRADPLLSQYLIPSPSVETPDMAADPLHALDAPPGHRLQELGYFEGVRGKINRATLRLCQREAFTALANYYVSGGLSAACVMSVGAGKTALGVVASLAFTRRRALVVTPGSVIRGTFDRALDHQAVGNVLYGLPGGALIPGCRPPKVLTLDREEGTVKSVTRSQLLAADIIVTNFHSLGAGDDPDDLLAKLEPEEIDFIVIDEAHIAASDSYQRLFRHFPEARNLLMSACFQRLDGKPIDADVVYRYRLIDSIADGNAKSLRVRRFAPDPEATVYEILWPDGLQEIVGREALMEIIRDDRKLANITAKSTEPIRQVMRLVRSVLDEQANLLDPVKPRVLFAALGQRHAEQIAGLAEEHGIPCGTLHYSETDASNRRTRERFEKDSGDLQGIVQLKMLGQGYDFPPICIVVPMRPYGSFSEFYQFVGRGIRVITHPALEGRVGPAEQFLDVVYHAELDLDQHIETIYRENDMDPITEHELPASWSAQAADPTGTEAAGTTGVDTAGRPEMFVIAERGTAESRVVHDEERVERRRDERELDAIAQRYAEYAVTTPEPVTFDQYVKIMRSLRD